MNTPSNTNAASSRAEAERLADFVLFTQRSCILNLSTELNRGKISFPQFFLMAYLSSVMARAEVEEFRVLFLDSKNRLLADEMQARGTVNHTPVYPREVVRRALELGATALILAHNHPSGDPTPSRADGEMTDEIRQAAEIMGIVLHDHIIVGNGRHSSFRREGLL